MESGEQVCKAESLNIIPMQSQTLKGDRAGRGERCETSPVHAARERSG